MVKLSKRVERYVVDAVQKVQRIPKSVTEQPSSIAGVVHGEYITDVGKLEDRLLILLDLQKVLGLETLAV